MHRTLLHITSLLGTIRYCLRGGYGNIILGYNVCVPFERTLGLLHNQVELKLYRKQQFLDCTHDVNQMGESIKYHYIRRMNSVADSLTNSMQVITQTTKQVFMPHHQNSARTCNINTHISKKISRR